MGREVRTISLDSTTAEIAAEISNFSAWVRQKLILQHLADGNEPIHRFPPAQRVYKIDLPNAERRRDAFGRMVIERYDTKRCNPYHKKGKCVICWPDHLTIEEHILEIARLYQLGIDDPIVPLGGEEE